MKLKLEQRNQLIAQYMPLASSLASKQKGLYSVEFEELRSAAYLGLVDAASRYDSDYGSFFGYAKLRICGEIKDYLRSLGFGSKGSNSKGCRGFGSLDAGHAASLAGKNDDLRAAFDEIAEPLSPQGRSVMWEHFVEGRRLKEIGKRLGLCESRVSQLIASCRRQIAAASESQPCLV